MVYIKNISFVLMLLFTKEVFNQEYKLVWSDEFTHEIGRDWTYEVGDACDKPAGCGWGNEERQWYQPENATVEDGVLKLTARFDGKYTSARMKTQGYKAWKYGRIEARIQLPIYRGSFPAFWTLGENISEVGWPACGEIDIMEHVNTEELIHGNIHYKPDTVEYGSYSGTSEEFDVTEYHVYRIDIIPSSMTWYIDEKQFHKVDISNGIHGTSEFHEPKYILLNHAVGGVCPGWDIDFEALPASMNVDWVRVYQIDDFPTTDKVGEEK